MTEILQKVSRSENSICPKCFHYIVCRAIDNQPCFECNQFAETEKWISVTERLPKAFEHVLINAPGDKPFNTVHEAHLRKDRLWDTGLYRYDMEDITHWMPLPEPPKEVDG